VKETHGLDMTDQELLERYRAKNDSDALGILLQRYTLLLLGVCMKYLKNEEEAKDAVQQVFLKVIHELQKYKVDYFKSWLYMVAKNHCLMRIREKQGKMTMEINERLQSTPEESSPEFSPNLDDKSLDLLRQSLDELNPEQRQCVTLFYLQKQSYQQVSEVTGFSLLQVKSYIQNGKRNLRLMIEKKRGQK
jgi:RNA polymerase sigma factor (sigma-70 family)